MSGTVEPVLGDHPSEQSKVVANEGLIARDGLFYCSPNLFWPSSGGWR